MTPSLSASPLVPAELTLEPWTGTTEQVELACRLESALGCQRIWFRFPREQAPLLTTRADPFVIATVRYAMGRFEQITVHGEVSAGLLANLADFQGAYAAFNHWQLPSLVRYAAAECRAAPARPEGVAGLTAFSGGVDSCFTVYRHAAFSRLEPKRAVRGALMLHGFDIPLDQPEAFARAAARSRALTEDAGLRFLHGATNLRTLPVPWEATFATAVAASLAFFQPAYAFGLVPSFQDWAHLHLEHGSNPVTDPLLSSLAFPVIHDGTGFGRIQKLRELTLWPAALRGMRVCWQGNQHDRNCCRCEKCLRTILMLRLCGVTRCEAFPLPLDLDALERLRIETDGGRFEFAYLLREAQALGIDEPWVGAARRALARSERRDRLRERGRRLAAYLPAGMRDALQAAGRRWWGTAGAGARTQPCGRRESAGRPRPAAGSQSVTTR